MHLVLGQDVTSLLSLCMAKWRPKWQQGWLYVSSNTKNAKSLLPNESTDESGRIQNLHLDSFDQLRRSHKTHYMNDSPAWCQNLCDTSVPLSKALYSNCSVVLRSHKAVGPVYMYSNINTSLHIKEWHRLLKKSRDHPSTVAVLQKYTHLLYVPEYGAGVIVARLSPPLNS